MRDPCYRSKPSRNSFVELRPGPQIPISVCLSPCVSLPVSSPLPTPSIYPPSLPLILSPPPVPGRMLDHEGRKFTGRLTLTLNEMFGTQLPWQGTGTVSTVGSNCHHVCACLRTLFFLCTMPLVFLSLTDKHIYPIPHTPRFFSLCLSPHTDTHTHTHSLTYTRVHTRSYSLVHMGSVFSPQLFPFVYSHPFLTTEAAGCRPRLWIRPCLTSYLCKVL